MREILHDFMKMVLGYPVNRPYSTWDMLFFYGATAAIIILYSLLAV